MAERRRELGVGVRPFVPQAHPDARQAEADFYETIRDHLCFKIQPVPEVTDPDPEAGQIFWTNLGQVHEDEWGYLTVYTDFEHSEARTPTRAT